MDIVQDTSSRHDISVPYSHRLLLILYARSTGFTRFYVTFLRYLEGIIARI